MHLAVYDLLGREVATLVDARIDAGVHQATFDGSDLASGMYILQVTIRPETGGAVQTYTRQLTLLK